MSYELEFTLAAIEDIEKHRKSGDKKILIKIDQILEELRTHPTTGTGKPEKLKILQTSHLV